VPGNLTPAVVIVLSDSAAAEDPTWPAAFPVPETHVLSTLWDTRVFTVVLSLPGVAGGAGERETDDIAPIGSAVFMPIDARSRPPAAAVKTPLFALCTESGGARNEQRRRQERI
jgi:hypothetical protein